MSASSSRRALSPPESATRRGFGNAARPSGIVSIRYPEPAPAGTVRSAKNRAKTAQNAEVGLAQRPGVVVVHSDFGAPRRGSEVGTKGERTPIGESPSDVEPKDQPRRPTTRGLGCRGVLG